MQHISKANDGKIAVGIHATLSGTTSAKGNIIAVDDFRGITFAYAAGAITDAGAAGGFTIEIQESPDTADTNFAAVADASLTRLETDLTVTSDTADNEPVGMSGYLGGSPYVRAVVTGTTGTDAEVYGVWMLSTPQYSPPSSDIAASVAAT